MENNNLKKFFLMYFSTNSNFFQIVDVFIDYILNVSTSVKRYFLNICFHIYLYIFDINLI